MPGTGRQIEDRGEGKEPAAKLRRTVSIASSDVESCMGWRVRRHQLSGGKRVFVIAIVIHVAEMMKQRIVGQNQYGGATIGVSRRSDEGNPGTP